MEDNLLDRNIMVVLLLITIQKDKLYLTLLQQKIDKKEVKLSLMYYQ